MSEQNEPDARTTRVEENGTIFPLLMLDDHEAVEAECRRTLMRHAGEMADACGLAGTEKFGSVSSIVPEQIDLQQLYTYAFTPRGTRFILAKSLDRAGVSKSDQAAVINGYVGFNGFNMAMSVLGHMRRLTPQEIEGELAKRAKTAAGISESKGAAGATNPPPAGQTPAA